jgi:LysR family glycine cleavage system transcriptional activator
VHRRLPSLTALRAFESAGRHESFKAASEELHVTQAAISRQVRLLETRLRVALFERLNRRVRLTEPGTRYLAMLRQAFDAIGVATDQVGRGSHPGRLVLSVDPGFAARWLMPRLRRFRTAHPMTEVDIVPSLELVPLPHPGIDAAIHYGKPSHPGLRHDMLLRVRAFPVCSPALRAGTPPLRRPADLRGHRLLHEASTDWWGRWLRAARVSGVDSTAGPIYHDSNLALDAAIAGEGVALGDDCLAFADLQSGRLMKPFRLACNSGTYYFVYPDLPEPDAAIAAFRTWLLGECRLHGEAAERLHCA